ncbi:MAG: penicillin acylase family protein [Chloroflexi bacterium]|nr:penicillin acylase family protein [Chloroflexota bacterium]
MNRVLHILAYILIGIFVLLIVGVLAATLFVQKPFPETAGTINTSDLEEEVNIYRDELGIPHIYANNSHDMFFAQGYVTAQDRFWQMEWWRHQSQGRMSEVVGESTLEVDKFLRNVGFNRNAALHTDYYKNEEPEVWAMLEAYSAGVNAWLAENEGKAPMSQSLLNLTGKEWEIAPWQPYDTVSWALAMAWDLKGSGGIFAEQELMLLEQAIGEETALELLPYYPYDNRPVIAPTDQHVNSSSKRPSPDTAAFNTDWLQINNSLIGERPPDWFGLGEDAFLGSNSWVVSGEHTDTGLPLLANDPHLGIQMPAIWYEIGLHAPGWDVVGFSLPSFPGVVIGHNEDIAWGFTNVGGDVQDLYIEKINPDNRLQYEYMGEWRDIEVIEEVIKVNGGEDVILEVRQTHHGPIINEPQDGVEDVLALRWTAAEVSHVFKAVIGLNTAEDYDDFREAASYFDIPPQNMVYADTEGNIAYQTPGLYPIRKNGDGLTPVPGWTDEYEWEGFIPFEEMPALLNPESGIIVTANNAVVDNEYSHHISLYWANGDRAQRIVDLIAETLAENGQITAEDYTRIQFDSYAMLAEAYVPLLTDLSSNDEQIQAAIEYLREWDYQERRPSVAAALFEMFYWHLSPAILNDDLGAAEEHFFWYSRPQHVFLYDLAEQPDADWWDNGETTAEETRDDILLQALGESVDWLAENVGGNMDKWTWGAIHTSTFESLPLGQSGIGPIEALVNRGPYPTDGGSGIVNATSWSTDEPAVVRAIPSMRMIVDMSALEASQTVIPTGQSGHPSNSHYDDQIELWLNGEYHPMLWGETAVRDAAVDHLVLKP